MTAVPVRQPLGRVVGRHSLGVEAVGVAALYALYEATRGLIAGDRGAAVRHAHDIASLERSLHLFVEGRVQDAAGALPGLIGALGLLYLTMHLAVTVVYLLWLHRRRPDAFPVVRTTLLIASALALIGFVAFPTAPPREAALGIADTISRGHVDLNHGLISSLYNPFAAVPSMHVGYAVIIGASLMLHGGRRPLRVLGLLYPALVVFVVVATGNHFFTDAVAGVIVAAVAALLARPILASSRGSSKNSSHGFAAPPRKARRSPKAVSPSRSASARRPRTRRWPAPQTSPGPARTEAARALALPGECAGP